MSLAWYYADSQRQQQGPVADSWLYNAYQRGEVKATTLVWREGMAQWLPLSQVASELGITMQNVPPTIPSAPRPPIAAKSGGSGCLVIGIVVLIGFIVVGAILAAIAIPAYQDYVQRARTATAYYQGAQLKNQVSAFYAESDRCPVNDDDGFGTPESFATAEIESINIGSLDDGRCAIQVMLGTKGPQPTHGAEIVFAMDSELQWTHTSTLPDKYLPPSLRQ